MKGIKNILVGFVVSFLGSIPLGYLNVIGFEIYSKSGIKSLILYLLGVILVEVFVIYFTLIFTERLASNKKLIKAIDYLAILFLLILGYSFYLHSNQATANPSGLSKYVLFSPFLIGLFLNSVNLLQFLFWTGWNLYLVNGNYISIQRKLKFYYVAGTLLGTFFGMLVFVLILQSLSQNTLFFSKYVLPIVIPSFFVVLAFVQMFKVYKKYLKKR